MPTGQQAHDYQLIADDIARVICCHDRTTFAGAVTDNTSDNKKAWKVLREKFPSMYFQGCCAHSVPLFEKGIFGATKTKQRGIREATYPDGYPFEILHDFVEDCKNVVKLFHNHHILKAQLCDRQNFNGFPMPQRAVPTRWGTIQAMAKTLLASERHIYALVSGRNFIQGTASQKAQRSEVRTTVTDERFVEKLENMMAILRPLDRLIVKYQSDETPISEVLLDILNLQTEFKIFHNDNIITTEERD